MRLYIPIEKSIGYKGNPDYHLEKYRYHLNAPHDDGTGGGALPQKKVVFVVKRKAEPTPIETSPRLVIRIPSVGEDILKTWKNVDPKRIYFCGKPRSELIGRQEMGPENFGLTKKNVEHILEKHSDNQPEVFLGIEKDLADPIAVFRPDTSQDAATGKIPGMCFLTDKVDAEGRPFMWVVHPHTEMSRGLYVNRVVSGYGHNQAVAFFMKNLELRSGSSEVYFLNQERWAKWRERFRGFTKSLSNAVVSGLEPECYYSSKKGRATKGDGTELLPAGESPRNRLE